MSRIIICDRCKTEIKPGDLVYHIFLVEEHEKTNAYGDLDFCDACAKEIIACIEKTPKTQPEPMPKKEKKPPKRYVKTTPPKEPDWGKAQALRDAGWTATRISKELGVTKSAVYEHTVKRQKEKKVFAHEWAEHELDLDPNARFLEEAKEEPDEQENS